MKRTPLREAERNKPRIAAPPATGKRPIVSDAGTLAVLGLLVALVVASVHWPVLNAKALTFDDAEYLTNNTLVRHPSWDSADRFLTEVLRPSSVGGYYQPLTMISLMLDYAAAGQADNLRPFHRTSLLLHVLNTLLVMNLLWFLFGRPWIAAGAALLFGVHPMTVEPIAWVGDRKTTLAAFFALSSLICYVRYARKPRILTYVLCAVAYVLALMSKPTATLLPAAMLLLDFWPLRRLTSRSVLEKVPLGVVAVISAIVTVVSQGNTASVGLPTRGSAVPMLLGLCHNVAFYPYKMLWPVNLTSIYAKPEPMSLANPTLLVMVACTAAMIAAALISLRWTRALLTGWLVFLLIILPTTGGIGFTIVIGSDKYAYLPAIGFLLILACLLARLAGVPGKGRPLWRPALVGLGVVTVGAVLSFGTRQYIQEWQTTERHEFYMLRLAPNSPDTHFGCANVFFRKGEYDQALRHYTRAIELDPAHAKAFSNRGSAYNGTGSFDLAIRDCTSAIELKPDYAEAYNNRGVAYGNLGDFAQAIRDCTAAVNLKPGYADAHCNLGMAYSSLRNYDQAIQYYSKGIELKPESAQVYNDRAVAYYFAGKYDQAWLDVERCRRMGGDVKADFVRALSQASSRPQ